MSGLTQKQEKFALAYIETGNASEAYRRAYDAGNMKPETIHVKASELLAGGNVSVRVAELREAISVKTVITEARAIEEAARIGLIDPGSLFDRNGALLPIKQMPPEIRAAISTIEFDDVTGKVTKVKLWDKNSALEKILRHLGGFEKDNRQRATVFDGVPRDTIRAITEKLKTMRAP